MKNICLLLVLGFVSLVGKAQVRSFEGFHWGAGVSLALPVYNMEEKTFGVGADLMATYGISNHFGFTADAGYTALLTKYNLAPTSVIPIRLGMRYFPVSNLYLGAKAGLGINTLGNASINYTAYSFGAGYMCWKKLDLGAAYDGYTNSGSSFGYAAIRVGYIFGK